MSTKEGRQGTQTKEEGKGVGLEKKAKAPYKIVAKVGREPSKISFAQSKTEAETKFKSIAAQMKKGRIALQSLQGNTYANVNGWANTIYPDDTNEKAEKSNEHKSSVVLKATHVISRQ